MKKVSQIIVEYVDDSGKKSWKGYSLSAFKKKFEIMMKEMRK